MRSVWSISTHKLYRLCPRKFYFSKIVASPTTSDDFRWKANYLRKLKSLPMLAGEVVHQAIKKSIDKLNRRERLLENEAVAFASGLLKARLEYSASGKYRTESKSEGDDFYYALSEHEYDIPVTHELIQDSLKIVESALHKYFQMELETKQGRMKLQSLIENASVRTVEDRNYKFQYEGWWIQPIFDLLLEFANQHRRLPVVIDWKVEKNESNDNSQQMHVYGYSIWKRWNTLYRTRPNDIALLEINLLAGTSKQHNFGQEELIAIDDLMFESIREFNYVLGDRKFEDFDIQEFGLTQNTNSCSYCTQRKICVEHLHREEKEHATGILKLF